MNPGSLVSHERWNDKFTFDFPIAADTERQVARAYGVLKENGGIERTVYIIDKTGVVRYAKRGMPSTQELLQTIDAINQADAVDPS